MSLDVDDNREDHEAVVTAVWRRRNFRELGFNRIEAQLLDAAGADWHEAEVLKDRGATLKQILQILV